jgi:hypothetical protein
MLCELDRELHKDLPGLESTVEEITADDRSKCESGSSTPDTQNMFCRGTKGTSPASDGGVMD